MPDTKTKCKPEEIWSIMYKNAHEFSSITGNAEEGGITLVELDKLLKLANELRKNAITFRTVYKAVRQKMEMAVQGD